MQAAPSPPAFSLSRAVFLRLLAVVYLIAFASLAVQITGLVGERGALPAGEFLGRAREVYGAGAYRLFPTLVWVSATDASLTFLCWSGVAASILLLAGIAPVLTTATLWLLYLSLSIAGQEFLQFQWDALLLETGLLAVLYAPLAWKSQQGDAGPPPIVRWVLWGLAFKVTWLSGITKILSGDPTWANLTALAHHYQTQPLPAPTSWFVHQLPVTVHVWSAAAMFAIEIGVPWLVFAPPRFRRARQLACALMIALQIGIGATGNYGFFNLLTIVLYLALLDDRAIAGPAGALRRVRGDGLRKPRNPPDTSRTRHESGAGSAGQGIRRAGAAGDSNAIGGGLAIWRVATNTIAACLAVFSAMTFFREIDITWGRTTPITYLWSPRLLRWTEPFNSVNGYGLFRVMTTERPEIVIEVSDDGSTWKEYPFRWKPGAVARRPAFVQPHMPRLDWQMWFAALGPESAQHWLAPMIDRLLAGDTAVTALLGRNPLPHAPRYARLAYYQYRFTTSSERAQTGAWWHREFAGYLTDTISGQPR